MLIYAFGSIVILFFNAVLWFFILSNRKRDLIVAPYLRWSLCIAGWSIGYAITLSGLFSYSTTLFWNRVCHAFASFIPVFFLQLVFSITQQDTKFNRLILKSSYFVGLILIALDFTPLFVKDLWSMGVFKYQPLGGSAYICFTLFFAACVIYGLIVLYWKYKTLHGNEREQVKIFLLGSTIGYTGGSTLFLQAFKIPLNPIGVFFISSYVLFTGYAIYRYGFMNLEIIIRRTAVFAGLFAFVYAIFTIVTVLGKEFFKSTLGWNEWAALVPTVAIITFTLRPLETFLTNITEKFLFQKKYDERELLRLFTNEILTVIDLQKLIEQTVEGLNYIIKLESAAVLLHDKDAKVYKLAAAVGIKNKPGEVIFKDDDTIISYLKASDRPILKDKDVDKIEGEGDLKQNFKLLNTKVCFPLTLHDNLIGVLCLGMKKSGEEYTEEDIDILHTLAKTEAIAISNAQLFDELSKTQAEAAQREKMAVIGTLAAGINHEICNPLGIVRGQCEMFLLNLRDGFYGHKTREEILKISEEIMGKVIKETDRAVSITKKLSGFAKPSKRSEFETVAIEKETEEVLGLLGHDLKLSNIEIQKDFPEDFPVILADKKQIQEVLFNIIRNAAQAIEKKQGKIVLTGFSENGSAVVRIADNGSGIPPEKLGQIFHPFYTTKAPGKGTGLGLFIVKQIVERNKGTIAVESEAGIGTTFTLRFPKASAMLVEHN